MIEGLVVKFESSKVKERRGGGWSDRVSGKKEYDANLMYYIDEGSGVIPTEVKDSIDLIPSREDQSDEGDNLGWG